MIDEKTTHLELPLPHKDNKLSEDVERLRSSLKGLDACAQKQDASLQSLTAQMGQLETGQGGQASELEALQRALGGKADTKHRHPAEDITSGILPTERGGTGNAEGKAAALAESRSIIVNRAEGKAGSFDGSKDVDIGVKGTLPVTRGGTGNAEGKASDAAKWNGATKTVSSAAPSGGQDGDVWFQYV